MIILLSSSVQVGLLCIQNLARNFFALSFFFFNFRSHNYFRLTSLRWLLLLLLQSPLERVPAATLTTKMFGVPQRLF
jgi:hypothetical protein